MTNTDIVFRILWLTLGAPAVLIGLTYAIVWVAIKAIQHAGGICP